MKTGDWSRRVLARYWLFQVPGTLLLAVGLIVARRWVPLPAWLIVLLILVWIAKDAVLFPLLWQAWDWERSGRRNTILGERGVAKERMAPSGHVLVRGELWRAQLPAGDAEVEEGGAIRVVGLHGMTLLVEREED